MISTCVYISAWSTDIHRHSKTGGDIVEFFPISARLCPSCCKTAAGRLRVVFIRDPLARLRKLLKSCSFFLVVLCSWKILFKVSQSSPELRLANALDFRFRELATSSRLNSVYHEYISRVDMPGLSLNTYRPQTGHKVLETWRCQVYKFMTFLDNLQHLWTAVRFFLGLTSSTQIPAALTVDWAVQDVQLLSWLLVSQEGTLLAAQISTKGWVYLDALKSMGILGYLKLSMGISGC